MRVVRSSIKRIALSTGGGDAPGLNAVIHAATLAARNRDWEVVGVRDGLNGLLLPDAYPDGGLIELTRDRVRGIIHQGGTIIGTTNRGNPTAYPVQQPDGTWIEMDRTAELLGRFEEHGIDALILVGGDGSMAIGQHLHNAGLRLVGVPKTIDNDLDKTTSTFGFDSAVDFASECIDRLFTTATSHGRIIVVEVMGRYAGWIALNAGMASGVHAILIPEIPFSLDPVAAVIRDRERHGAKFSIVCVAEGARPVGGEVSIVGKSVGQAERLGGIGAKVAAELERMTGREARTVVLGHLLRGGSPTSFDRLLGLRFGAAAVRALDEGHSGVMVALNPPTVDYVPLAEATHRQKTVPLDCDSILTARDMGINFGDQMPTHSAIGG
ncbi:ATP-dependent 6-phosphofructokinase 2 [Mycobacterium persicum]|uniref:ATP-dependent 6-phosphofructokinase n=1 Tax=Mycobacterium persicum TaxID=1487726 RepID=A0AB38UVI9_9MYCO|nr:ATP-dependent 6-phosphofructokinase 2 [Mycobacterium persicum]VAZ84538.1 ATP-dependent 6-phosphofructokinase 2 [Mycobacterium persicum]VAZ95905.1 ATP-dependent 6-phosphofructokinase 2 [Mycobacterium persicum]